jgi:hypothetical protein
MSRLEQDGADSGVYKQNIKCNQTRGIAAQHSTAQHITFWGICAHADCDEVISPMSENFQNCIFVLIPLFFIKGARNEHDWVTCCARNHASGVASYNSQQVSSFLFFFMSIILSKTFLFFSSPCLSLYIFKALVSLSAWPFHFQPLIRGTGTRRD